jgi:Phospholipase_D-nuclease N-terminal/Short C-terminal domain
VLVLAYDYPLGGVLVSVFWIVIWVLWIMLLWHIFGDIFRSDDLGGGGKAAWTLFVVFLPFLGSFVYLLARGSGMGQRQLERAAEREQQFRSYVRQTAGSGSTAEELGRLAALKESGVLTEAEFAELKAKLLT